MSVSDSSASHSTPLRRVMIAGASGLVGHHILAGLLADDTVSEVHALCRRNLAVKHPKLCVHLVDFNELPPLPPVDELYLAIGTTMKIAGSQNAFRKIDFDTNLAVARSALAAGARRIALVSAAGANSSSSNFYSRVKGELEEALEEALAELDFDALLFVRPSLLLGDRGALGQPQRFAEKWAAAIFKLLGAILPLSWRPVAAQQVAAVLLTELPLSHGKRVLSSAEIQN